MPRVGTASTEAEPFFLFCPRVRQCTSKIADSCVCGRFSVGDRVRPDPRRPPPNQGKDLWFFYAGVERKSQGLVALARIRSIQAEEGRTSLSIICWAQRMDRCNSSAVTEPAELVSGSVPVASLRNSTAKPR